MRALATLCSSLVLLGCAPVTAGVVRLDESDTDAPGGPEVYEGVRIPTGVERLGIVRREGGECSAIVLAMYGSPEPTYAIDISPGWIVERSFHDGSGGCDPLFGGPEPAPLAESMDGTLAIARDRNSVFVDVVAFYPGVGEIAFDARVDVE